jgi:hypothetical protein
MSRDISNYDYKPDDELIVVDEGELEDEKEEAVVEYLHNEDLVVDMVCETDEILEQICDIARSPRRYMVDINTMDFPDMKALAVKYLDLVDAIDKAARQRVDV